MRKLVLIIPSFNSGGLERVVTELSWYFYKIEEIIVHIITLTHGDAFYKLPKEIAFHQPTFNYKNYHRFIFTIKTFFYLRKKLKEINPDSFIIFGGHYTSFALLSSLFLKINKYVSDRARPTYSYGKVLDIINPIFYRFSTGIIAQTSMAKKVLYEKTKHKNISVINNPIRHFCVNSQHKENIILNVGRFSKTKNQNLLLEYYKELYPNNWLLIFLGEGEYLNDITKMADKLGISEKVKFTGAVKNIDDYYSKSAIFAFTSTSEGFPNALGEAMAAGCACISFDCEAGPSDLIDDNINGFLVPVGNHRLYKEKLKLLIEDEELRLRFGEAAKKKIEVNFRTDKIAEQYLNFILK